MKVFKTLAITALLAVACLATNAQKVSNIDFDEIENATTSNTSVYYYPDLLELYLSRYVDLSDEQCTYLYYGSVFAEDYNPFWTSEDIMSFYSHMERGEYAEAIHYGRIVINKHPIDISALSGIIRCYKMVNDTTAIKEYVAMRHTLLRAILISGDGRSEETAYVAIQTLDEGSVAEALGFDVCRMEFINATYTNVLYVKPIVETSENKGIEKLYFKVVNP